MKARKNGVTFLSWIAAILLVASCGLQYTPVESPEAFEARRIEAIETYCKQTFSQSGAIYTSIQFGESKLIRPAQFKTLDSLYAIKYELEKQRKTEKQVEEQIYFERLRLQQAAISPIYLEEHLFSIKEGDSITFYFCTFQLTKETAIEDVRIEQSIHLASRDEDRYFRFLSEYALFYGANYSDQSAFYSYYKQKADQLSGLDLDQFIGHVMRLMETMELVQSTSIKRITEQNLMIDLFGKSYKQKNIVFKWNNEPSNSWRELPKNGFTITATYPSNGTTTETSPLTATSYTLDPYLVIQRKEVISTEE